jgi:hypothetical protein
MMPRCQVEVTGSDGRIECLDLKASMRSRDLLRASAASERNSWLTAATWRTVHALVEGWHSIGNAAEVGFGAKAPF